MTRLIHIADLHFGDESRDLVDAFTEYCLADPPTAVIATGDFTQGGRRREFNAAREFFEGLNVPVIGAPGNHDVPSYALDHRFITPWERFFRLVGSVVSPRLKDQGLHVETLHTARRGQFRLDWSLGRVSKRDLNTLIKSLEETDGATRIAACHHPLLAPDGATGRADTRRGPEAAVALAETCDLVLTGHLHRSFALPIHGENHTCWFVGASTAFSKRTRIEPAGFNEILLEDTQIHLVTYAADSGRFKRGGEQSLPRTPRRDQ
tara:strand:- start:6283 stop:7074 length:792 start_codon:yes stop_codon:yes gene_type:complete